MDLRQALYELAAEHRLDARGFDRLEQLAGLHEEPAAAATWLPRGVATLAAALGGLGVVFWIAANWDTLGRFGRFALLEGLLLAMCVGALARPAARAPLGLLALLGTGALFAYFGQTYQTGADPWQLFAIWAALTLTLCLAARSDVLWAPWALIAMTGVSLWVHAHIGHRWKIDADDLRVHLIGWLAAFALVAALAAPLRRYTGAGIWALRTALTLAVIVVTTTAFGGLFGRDVLLHYLLGLLVLGIAGVALSWPLSFDIYGLSAVALALDSLLVAGIANLTLRGIGFDNWIGALLVIGLSAAGLLAATVALLMRLARRPAFEPAAP